MISCAISRSSWGEKTVSGANLLQFLIKRCAGLGCTLAWRRKIAAVGMI